MHLGHDYGEGMGGHAHHHHGHGHNQPGAKAAQWQTPHLPHDGRRPAPEDPRESDLDLVEAAFVEAFGNAADVTSFLRVAGVPFVGEDATGRRLYLLRVETEYLVDVGAVAMLLGGEGMRYDPLPAKMTSRRRRLAFLFHDGQALRRLDFAAARALTDRTEASSFDIQSHARSA
jgi:hypothetical protein